LIYYTGDIHGSTLEIVTFCMRFKPTKDDTIVILGDVGANYFGDLRDNKLKEEFSKLEPTIFCIHGNHEMRPWNIPTYNAKEWNGGTVWYEEKYPNILFAKDGEIFDIEGTKHLVIGGAYSVDKYYRLSRGYGWWEDEQPSEEIKQYVEKQIKEKDFDVILSHTCPFKYEPIETFLPGIDQSTVDQAQKNGSTKLKNLLTIKRGTVAIGISINASTKSTSSSTASKLTKILTFRGCI